MTQLLNNDGFGIAPIYNNATIIEETSFDHFLSKMIHQLKTRISSTSDKLEPCLHVDDVASQAIEMLNALEVLQMHLEFILQIFLAKDLQEVKIIKQNAHSISLYYQKVTSKDDISQIPVKIALAILHDKIILEFDRRSKFFFKQSRYGGHQLIKSADNIALMKIIIGRCETGLFHLPYVLVSDKDDIFNFPKTSELWQDIYKSAIFKSHLNKEEAVQSFKMMRYASNVSHILVRRLHQSQSKAIPLLQYLLPLAQDALYYSCLPSKAEIEALNYLINPEPEAAIRVWNLVDTKMAHIFFSLRLPKLAFDDLIYIPRLFPRITKELILQEYQDNTINKVVPMDPEVLRAPDLTGKRAEVLKELLIPGENKIPIRILSTKPINLNHSDEKPNKGLFAKAKEMFMGAPEPAVDDERETAIIINLHGGGFIAMSSASMRIYLSRWCKDLKMVCFAVDYRLAPQNPYPAAIDDIWQAYLWILNYSETILGIKNKRIIFAGDSSGGNLAMAITLRILKAGLQAPHACIMIYPCLQLDKAYSSPNSFLSLDDSVIHSSLLKICIKSYVGEEMDALKDPFISPVFASDELLAKMPPVRIISGVDDPLQDDNWRVVAKLRKLNRDVKIIAHAHLSHGFMCYQDLKGFDIYIKEACELILDLLKKPNEEK